MLKQPVTDIFFDLDHTLWDFERNSALTYDGLFRHHGMEVRLEEFLGHYVPLNLLYWKQFREGKINQQTLRYQRLKTVFDRMGYPITTAQIHLLSQGYLEQLSTHTHLIPNCLEVLEYLRGRYRLHIITNGFEEVQLRKLRNSKIDHYFTEVVNSDRAGAKKPDPRIFRVALAAAGIAPQQGVMIGDNTEADILGARSVGLQALHFNVHGEPGHELCPIIYDLREIKSFL